MLGKSSKDSCSLSVEMPTGCSNDGHRIGAWNAQLLKQQEQELIEEMKRCNLGVLGGSEIR